MPAMYVVPVKIFQVVLGQPNAPPARPAGQQLSLNECVSHSMVLAMLLAEAGSHLPSIRQPVTFRCPTPKRRYTGRLLALLGQRRTRLGCPGRARGERCREQFRSSR